MENYKEEIAKLQTQLDELKSKIEKPKFEVGKWYKTKTGLLINYQGDRNKNEYLAYGFSTTNYWHDKISFGGYDELTQATPKEVEEALTKEAVKRGFKDGVKVKGVKYDTLRTVNNPSNIDFWMKDNILWMDADTLCNSIDIFRCGVWGEVIKTKTIEELVNDIVCEYPMQKFSLDVFIKQYLTENKQEIIETLNNL